MDKKEQLKSVIDAIINGDNDAAVAAFAPYVQAKTREVLGYDTVEPAVTPTVNEAFMKKLNEFIELQNDSPVQFKGDRVFVDGKEVGVMRTDHTDLESGIEFIEKGDGSNATFNKEFDELESLYDFLIQRYTKRGNV